jgi:hypothetical protein
VRLEINDDDDDAATGVDAPLAISISSLLLTVLIVFGVLVINKSIVCTHTVDADADADDDDDDDDDADIDVCLGEEVSRADNRVAAACVCCCWRVIRLGAIGDANAWVLVGV